MRLFIAAAARGSAVRARQRGNAARILRRLRLARPAIASPRSKATRVANSTTLPHEQIVIRSAATGRVLATIDPCAGCDYSGLAFAPDGRLAFLEREARSTHAADARRRQAAPVTLADDQRHRAGAALLARRPAHRAAGHLRRAQGSGRDPGRRPPGRRNRRDRMTSSGSPIVPASGGTLTPVSPADRYVYEYDWTPDGSGFVVTPRIGNGDNNWWIAELDRIDAATGAVHRIAAPKMQMNQPRVSPDGRTVAFIGGHHERLRLGRRRRLHGADRRRRAGRPHARLSRHASPRCCGAGPAWSARR